MKKKINIDRKTTLKIISAVFITIGLIYFIYWFLVLRNHQSTDDAYVAGNQVQIMPQVTGIVTQINFDNTDLVNKGSILVVLDPTNAEQTYEQAKTALANSVRQTHQLIINSKQLAADVSISRTNLAQAQSDLKRREALAATNYISKEELQHSRDAVKNAQDTLTANLEKYNANQAIILDTPLAEQPAIKQAASQVRDSWLALQRTKILSPVTGYVSQRNVQVGSQVALNRPLMAVIPAEQMWVDANFKETQLAKMRIGQSAKITSDLYGKNIVYNGKVAGIDMGTGSAFSLLPAQNATGNWIKVVQRLPVKIEITAEQLQKYPLRIGLSMNVTVDTTNQTGTALAQTTPAKEPAYSTDVLTPDLTPINRIIDDIIQQNAG